MASPSLSALVVARDEEANLESWLASTRFADERIVVVDARSRDATLEIARRGADRVVVREFDNFAAQRNAGLELARGEWILSLDADERIPAPLAREIQTVLADRQNPHVAFRIPIRSEILGRPFTHSGTQDDLPVRLFRAGCGRWTGMVHETVAIRGSIGRLENPIDHRTLPDVRSFLRKIEEYTTLEALNLHQAGRRYRTSELAFRPVWTFLKLYLAKQGFRDGLEGLMFCVLSGVSVAIRVWKLRELGVAGGGS